MKSVLQLFGFLGIISLFSHLTFTLYSSFIRSCLRGKNSYLTVLKTETSVLSSVSISKFVTTISQVGEYHLTIDGYTSPFALVEVSTGLFTVTEMRTADATGYFIFKNILLHPFLSKEPCLFSTDKNGISTPPLCLSEIPKGKDVFITGVILAPSLVLEKGQSLSGKNVLASGFTTPNSSIDLYLFREEKKWFFTNWIRTARAKGAPIFNFKSNPHGYFEFNLPSYLPTTYRLFVASKFQEFNSPKSNTLKFKVLSFWEQIILSIYNLLYLLWLIIKKVFANPLFLFFLEIGVILLLVFLLKRKKKSLMSRSRIKELKGPGF